MKAVLNEIHDRTVFRRRVRVLSELLSREIKGGTSVLDIGCGDGSVGRGIMALQPHLVVRGVEVQLRPETQIPVDVFDGPAIPFPDSSFDWVIIVDVLHHTEEPRQLIGEARRIARHGILIKDHLCHGFAASSTLRVMDWVGNRGRGVKLLYNYPTRGKWAELFAEAELDILSWKDDLGLYPFPFSLLFDRRLHFIAMLRAPE